MEHDQTSEITVTRSNDVGNTSTSDELVSDLLDFSREYIKHQKAAKVQLSPELTDSSPGVILSRALAGAAKIQRA
jgi:hypothetical protein